MLQDTVLWTLAGLLVIAFAVVYIDPRTRPYARKYGWGFLVLAGFCVGYALLRRRPGRSEDVAMTGGKQIAEKNLTAVDRVVESALEAKAKADLDLVRSRVEAEEKRAVLDAEVEALHSVDDSLERRKALIALARKYEAKP